MIGTMLGNRYELMEKIGEGGMAEVYKAKCHYLNRYVAVKILKNEYSVDKGFVEKFKREASSAASLSHNNIVTIYDVGSQENIHYIVLEYVDGKTLKEIILKEGKLDYSTSIQIATQIGRALECAHKNNIIHRDIKPHNIMVTEDGVIKVMDFGIAKASNSATITNTTTIMGSAHYFSPEQAKGSYVDARSDIYSLGIVLYEMVTGRVPYDADSPVSVALKHIQEPVVPPKQLNESIPESLNKFILKLIEKEPIKRYQNVKDMLVDLRKIQNNQDVNIVTQTFDIDKTRIMAPVNEADYEEDEEDDDEYDDDNNISKVKKYVIIASVVVLVLAVGLISGYLAFNRFNNKDNKASVTSKGDRKIPKIVGLSQDEAKKLVEGEGLKFTVTNKEKSDKAEGTVLRCYPDEGMNVKPNSEVRVSISSGGNKSTVPDFKKIDISSVKDMIASSNGKLKLGNVSTEFSDSVAKDYVISQTPEPDSEIVDSAKIDLVVSKGPKAKETEVPDLKDKNIDQASAILANYKLKLGNRNEINTTDKSLDGKIVNQSIEAGVTVKEGTAVSVSYYKYKEPSPGEQASVENIGKIIAVNK